MTAKPRYLGVACPGVLMCAAALTLLDAGCVKPAPDEEVTEVTQGELAAVDPNWLRTRLWPNGVKVCFTSPDNADLTTAQRNQVNQAKTDAISALQETWAASSALTFTNVGDCPTTIPSGTLKIALEWYKPDGPGNKDGGIRQGGWCGTGIGAWCIVEANDINWVKPIAVHEVGHALGIPHEHQRANAAGTSWEVPLCPEERAIYDREVADGGTSGDRQWDKSYWKLTTYDPDSVMNYCSAKTGGRRAGDYRLTDRDKLGIEMLYPRFWTSPAFRDLTVACGTSCFNTGSGPVARSNGSVTLGWTARGALDLRPTWSTPSGGFQAQYLPVSRLTADYVTNPVLQDRLGRTHWGKNSPPGQRVITSNSKHTAILVATLP